MDNVELNTFPASKLEALALLYIQKQDLSGITPEQLLDMYEDAYKKMKARDDSNKPHDRRPQKISC